MLTKDFAICIRASDFSETSQIVTFFTRASGKIRAIAKGSKRQKSSFDGAIELFSHGKIVFADSSKKKLVTLTEFEQEGGLTHLSKNLFAFNCCLLAIELLNTLTNDYDPHTDLFDSFLQFLQNTNELQATRIEKRETLALLILFQLSLLKEVGLQPILSHCVNCKSKHERRETRNEIYFSNSANGLVCRDCEGIYPDRIRVGKHAAGCLTNLKMLAGSNEKTLNEVEKILLHHFTHLSGCSPKLAKYILENLKA